VDIVVRINANQNQGMGDLLQGFVAPKRFAWAWHGQKDIDSF
jgi:hypothetical protein